MWFILVFNSQFVLYSLFFYAHNRVEHLVRKVTELQETLQQYLTNINED